MSNIYCGFLYDGCCRMDRIPFVEMSYQLVSSQACHKQQCEMCTTPGHLTQNTVRREKSAHAVCQITFPNVGPCLLEEHIFLIWKKECMTYLAKTNNDDNSNIFQYFENIGRPRRTAGRRRWSLNKVHQDQGIQMVEAGAGQGDEKMVRYNDHQAEFIYPAVTVSGLSWSLPGRDPVCGSPFLLF